MKALVIVETEDKLLLQELNYPTGVTSDASGSIYIADGFNNLIRIVNTSGIINTIAGNYNVGYGYSGDGGPATDVDSNFLTGIAVDAPGNIYIVDQNNGLIRIVNTSGIINTFAGNYNEGTGYSGDDLQEAPATDAELSTFSRGIVLDISGNVYITDGGNNIVRNVMYIFTVSTNVVTNASCDGQSNGSASVTPSHGTSPYTYSWSPGGETNFHVLPRG